MSPESRRWKRAYTENVEAPYDHPRVELIKQQKDWLGRAWVFSFGYIPNAVPIYNEEEGFAHRRVIHLHWHHVVPIGEMTRLNGTNSTSYNNPRNIVPVESLNHTGFKALDDDFVIHEDTKQALREYWENKKAFADMSDDRRELTAAGMIYHASDYDVYFLQLADEVSSKYELNHPEDPFPPGV